MVMASPSLSSHGKSVVFLGPSLPLKKAIQFAPLANYLPPVRCGDILAVLRSHPRNILIVDGYFEHTAAVWHKEILFALSRNITVYGASSMGALRAAEMTSFGMIGIGKIFEWYQQGHIEDDDEVALLHKNESYHYEPLTHPLVNIRATVESALTQNLLDTFLAQEIIQTARSLYYGKRSFLTICEIVKKNHPGFSSKIDRFLTFVNTTGYIDQKHLDAIEALKILNQNLSHTPRPEMTVFASSQSTFLRTLQRTVSSEPLKIYRSWLPIQEKVAMTARLLPEYYPAVKTLARLMAIVYNLSIKQTPKLEDGSLFGISPRYEDQAWQIANDCNDTYNLGLIDRLKYIQHLAHFQETPIPPSDIQYFMLAFLKLSNDYSRYKKNNEAQVLAYLQEKNPLYYCILLYTAYLWRVVENAALRAELEFSKETLQKQIAHFCQLRQLSSEKALSTWMKKHDLSSSAFKHLVSTASRFDYLVKHNNFDLLFAKESDYSVFWLLDALYLSELYPKAKDILHSPKVRDKAVLGVRQKLNDSPESFLIKFDFPPDIESFNQFIQEISEN